MSKDATKDNGEYDRLPLGDDDPSATEVDNFERKPTVIRRSWIFHRFIQVVIVFWATVLLAGAVAILSQHIVNRQLAAATSTCVCAPHDQYRVAEDFTSNVPQFGTTLLQFDETMGFTFDPRTATTADVEDVLHHWASLSPIGDGFILSNNSRELLPEPKWIAGAGEGLHNLAVYHQMHCLYRLMMAYNDAVLGTPTDVDHARHCFNYIRQTIMCVADTTLEGVNPDSERPETARVGAHRVCKDYSQVQAWAQAHRRQPVPGYNPHPHKHEGHQ
ncbi:hypothetical protein Sste5346_003774 [Sporothrix stenoceras]|uniref:Oxidase ustYa n=1 Tax=Sporothrix stenoceras TaxID=5173 RepID=A0ABR3ZC88_9PEZI